MCECFKWLFWVLPRQKWVMFCPHPRLHKAQENLHFSHSAGRQGNIRRDQSILYIGHKYMAIFRTNPTTAKPLQTNPKVDQRSEEANKPTSSGHNSFKSGPVEKMTTTLDSSYPIVKYMYYVFFPSLFHPQNFVNFKKSQYKGITRTDSVLSLPRWPCYSVFLNFKQHFGGETVKLHRKHNTCI